MQGLAELNHLIRLKENMGEDSVELERMQWMHRLTMQMPTVVENSQYLEWAKRYFIDFFFFPERCICFK